MPGPPANVTAASTAGTNWRRYAIEASIMRQVSVVARQPLPAGLPRRPHPPVADVRCAAARRPGHRSTSGSSTMRRMSSSSACRSSPRSGPLGQCLGQSSTSRRASRPDSAWSNSSSTSSSTSTADCATRVSRIGYRRSSSRRARFWAVEPAPDPRQEPAPLGGQHRQVQRVGVHPAQERELFQFGLSPPPASPHRAGAQATPAACARAPDRRPAARPARPAGARSAAARPASQVSARAAPARPRRAPGRSPRPGEPAGTTTGTRTPAGTAASASRAPSPARTGTPPGPSTAAASTCRQPR